MERAYCDKCADYGHRAKVYTMRRKDFPRVFGNPDLCILFTSTVSHTMTQAACELARKKKVTVLRSHTSSLAALDGLLRAFLTSYGYEDFSIESALGTLARHMICGESFPHEIGVFLDYPLADVAAFIENEGRNCRCVGCWKAYSNIDEARRLFALYRKCRDVYMACYQRGFGVARLTVAA